MVKGKIIVAVIVGLSFWLTGCGNRFDENGHANIPCGNKVIGVTDGSQGLKVVYRPFRQGEEPETVTVETYNYGHSYVFQETKCPVR